MDGTVRRGRSLIRGFAALAGAGLLVAAAAQTAAPAPLRASGQSVNPFGGAVCVWPKVTARGGDSCRCAEGYREEAGACRRLGPAEAVRAALESEPLANRLLTSDVALIQRCLKEAGYLSAPAGDAMDEEAWTAFWLFKQDHPVGPTLKGVHDIKAQHTLFGLCPEVSLALPGMPDWVKPARARAIPPAGPGGKDPSAALEAAPSAVSPAPATRPDAGPETGCLPDDLHRLIVETYGPRETLERCAPACLPVPKSLARQEVEALGKREGLAWCSACIEVESHLPLEDILRIERGADVALCARPPSRLPDWPQAGAMPARAYTRVRERYRGLPPGADHGGDIAVVIGNRTYRNDIPANARAHANAGAVYALLTEHLGYRQENIVDLRDADLGALTRVFGSREDHRGALWRLVRDREGAGVLVYYAGHATTAADESESYLLPVDAVEHREARTAYPMSLLYANIAKLGAESVLMLLEAGFGRDLSGFVFPPNLPEMPGRSLPPGPVPGLTVITAARMDQKTLVDPKYGIGLFTRHLIDGLAGRADLRPIGNADSTIDAVELYAYTARMVRLAARKSFGLLQNPVMNRSGNVLVSRVRAHVR